jgi:FtsP/CotA-like multicopper oxidase with cupredoxin domain
MHRHGLEVLGPGAPLAGAPTASTGIIRDAVLVDAMKRTEVELIADHPGHTLLHCHQQDHMDNGLMTLIHYA